MTAIVPVLRALVRDEMAATSSIELGVVTAVATNEGGSGDRNGEVNVRLRGSGLELQRAVVAAARTGFSVVPRVGDLVVVGLVGGALDAPVVLGVLHTDQVHPPDAKPTECVYEVPDEQADGVRRAEIRLPSGNRVTIEDNTLVIEMGGSTVTVADGSVTVKVSKDITLEADGDIAISAKGSLKLEAMSSVDIEAATNLTAKASAAAKLSGATTTIAGITSFSAG